MMTLIQAFILGVVEGLTEFIPVSSTGHLIIAAELLHIAQTEVVKTFEVAIQSGAILAVVFLYWHTIIRNRPAIKNTLIAFLPTAVIGVLMYGIIKTYLLGSLMIVALGLGIGGVVLILVERYLAKKDITADGGVSIEQLSVRSALVVGLVQSFAIIPGVSRSASSMIGGMMVGMNRKNAAEFSFLLAIPTIFGSGAFDMFQMFSDFPANMIWHFIIGFVVSFVVAIMVIKLFIAYLQKYPLSYFGVYRILVALVIGLVMYL